MRCEEVQESLEEYIENRLPELSRRRVGHHLAVCEACRSEYNMIKESGEWIRSDKKEYSSAKMTKSIVDAVMSRILSEEKWAIPIGKKVFTLTATMRRYGVSAAVILFMLFSFTLYSNTDENQALATAFVSKTVKAEVEIAEVSTDGAGEIASIQTEDVSNELPEAQSEKKELAEVASPVIQNGSLSTPEQTMPNYGLILSIFGILITVITMSWMTRA